MDRCILLKSKANQLLPHSLGFVEFRINFFLIYHAISNYKLQNESAKADKMDNQ